ncbi:DOF zinc finger protein [Rhodopirellula baltica WH47]|uniref:DOF zinc finger protein n=1 Tax=Rhodopirellula baltica WH47 TaxID=991778 RepID=F2AZW1_RHOBT|nr:DOF zinc finger protein [Rhodopirellula baltica WH47]
METSKDARPRSLCEHGKNRAHFVSRSHPAALAAKCPRCVGVMRSPCQFSPAETDPIGELIAIGRHTIASMGQQVDQVPGQLSIGRPDPGGLPQATMADVMQKFKTTGIC